MDGRMAGRRRGAVGARPHALGVRRRRRTSGVGAIQGSGVSDLGVPSANATAMQPFHLARATLDYTTHGRPGAALGRAGPGLGGRGGAMGGNGAEQDLQTDTTLGHGGLAVSFHGDDARSETGDRVAGERFGQVAGIEWYGQGKEEGRKGQTSQSRLHEMELETHPSSAV